MAKGNESSTDGEPAVSGAETRERADDSERDDDSEGRKQIYHRKLAPDAEEANRSLLRLIANLERCEVTELPPLYEQVDHLVEKLFTAPPPSDAQAELAFSYYGYRVELDQSGNVSLMKLAGEPPVDPEE
ncbi:HalOD1 output domain-containing protein [Halorussus halobius]|uniref:HalOD1 output domain-containing protein n=1 Tax=Halorussus halobius TaxID=1710537 RepID=UPI001092698A|nr:HalOD1 output domain-containing protein [Halorussus halobius]